MTNRTAEIEDLTSKGIIPYEKDLEDHPENRLKSIVWLSGRVAAQIHDILPAKEIIDNMVQDASQILIRGASLVSTKARL